MAKPDPASGGTDEDVAVVDAAVKRALLPRSRNRTVDDKTVRLMYRAALRYHRSASRSLEQWRAMMTLRGLPLEDGDG
jgi:hypothetical protein